jgi:Transposase DDE domain
MPRLGYHRRPPAYGTFQGLFTRLDAGAFEPAVARRVDRMLAAGGAGPLRAVALDGKTSRGSRTHEAPAIHLLSALDLRAGCVLAQARVPAEANEHEAARELLKAMVLDGRVISGDAIFCRRDLCRQVVDDGGHYLIKVDANRPTLESDIASAFGPAPPPLRAADGRGRGRRGDHAGQARRPGRAAATGHDDEAQRPSRLAGRGPGRSAGAGGDRRR